MPRVGRNREKHKRLPKGWTPIGSAVYFVPTNKADLEIVRLATGGRVVDGKVEGGKKSLRLGPLADHNVCSVTYKERIVDAREARDVAMPGTVGELAFMALRDILPTFENEATAGEKKRHWTALRERFGHKPYARSVHEAALEPRKYFSALDVQKHLDDCANTRHVAANREVDSWSMAFQWARNRWGRTEYNPCAGVEKNPEASRDTLPTHDAVYKGSEQDESGAVTRGVYRELSPPMRFVVNMYRYYGRRRGETLRLTLADIQHDDGVHMLRGKEKQRRVAKKKGVPRKPRTLIIPWDPRLRRMVDRYMVTWRSRKVREALPTTAFLVTRDGLPFGKEAAKSAWRRAMERAGQAGTFVLHDLRALRADTLPEEVAEDVLALDSRAMLRKTYRNRGPKVIDFKGHK